MQPVSFPFDLYIMKFVVPYKFEKDAVTGKPERKSSQDEAPDSPGSLLT